MRDRWKGETVCIAACGPSLTAADVDYAGSRADRFIVINESWRLAPDADALYAADAAWWMKRGPQPTEFRGEHWSTSAQWSDAARAARPHMNWVETKGGVNIVDEPPICTGNNSTFQAMSLAVIWGVTRIVFIGLDLKLAPDGKDHWFGFYPDLTSPRNALGAFVSAFNCAAPQLKARGVEVVNASRETALECFPRMRLEHALP